MLEHHAPLIRAFSRPEAVLGFNRNVEIALKNIAYALWRMDTIHISSEDLNKFLQALPHVYLAQFLRVILLKMIIY